MKIGEMVYKYRDEHGMSQKDFARKCGLSSAIIVFLERGYRDNGKPYLPKFDTIKKIANGMGMTAEALTECDDFDLDISVGPEEIPIVEDFIKELYHQAPDEAMLLQAYKMIPIEHRIEAMQAIFLIKDKYAR